MTRRLRTLAFALGLVLVIPMLNLFAQSSQSTEKSDPLIGTWLLNVSKSKYNPGPPPKSMVRTFDYTIDEKVLCTFTIERADGRKSFGHWVAKLDGSEGPEFSRAAGATPTVTMTMKRVGPSTFEMTGKRRGENRLFATGAFTISNEGKILTVRLKNETVDGRLTDDVAIFEKQQ